MSSGGQSHRHGWPIEMGNTVFERSPFEVRPLAYGANRVERMRTEIDIENQSRQRTWRVNSLRTVARGQFTIETRVFICSAQRSVKRSYNYSVHVWRRFVSTSFRGENVVSVKHKRREREKKWFSRAVSVVTSRLFGNSMTLLIACAANSPGGTGVIPIRVGISVTGEYSAVVDYRQRGGEEGRGSGFSGTKPLVIVFLLRYSRGG